MDYYSYFVAEMYVTTLLYGDTSGLTDFEENWLNTFLREEQLNRSDAHWEAMPHDGDNFRTCEVSEKFADCVEVRYYFPTSDT